MYLIQNLKKLLNRVSHFSLYLSSRTSRTLVKNGSSIACDSKVNSGLRLFFLPTPVKASIALSMFPALFSISVIRSSKT
uniref:Uncharacterized protein n=1 Tax=Romanomermis culicivorax TaxID=13658 RepID=A0A915J8F9_ROMCU